ncbi:MAG: EAL domain-containing protein [Steroidobacteraceae bacterium]
MQLQLGVSGSVLVDRSRLRVILDYIPEGILTCDAHGRVDGMNAAAERIFGYAESQLLGARLDVVLPDFGPQDLTSSLDRLAMRQAVSHRELAGHNVVLRHRNGAPMPGEILVSRTQVSGAAGYVVYIRDDTERSRTDLALRDSEARYRVLVENAPEAILVLDVDSGRFVDCNENAVRYFRMPRNDLMAIGPEQVSPQLQPDGNPSAAVLRENIDAALSCASPAFEWLHCDATGQDIASEVRFVRLPSAGRRLLRASIIDIAGRKRIESIAAGERRVFEKIASSSTLVAALDAITEVIESVNPDAVCCIRLYDPVRRILVHAAGPRLPRSYLAQMEEVPAEIRFGSCAAAVVLERQVVVPDIASDPFWEYRREAALTVGLHACWSTPIIASDGRLLGTFATYCRRCGLPSRRDLEVIGRMTQLARIAIEKRRTEDAVRASEQRFRGLFENVVEGVYQATLDGDLIDANPALVTMLGHAALNPVRDAWRDGRLFVDPGAREAMISRLVRAGEIVGAEFEMLRADGTAITVRENVRVTRDGQGRITGYEGTIGDVTERRRAEQRLFAEKERALVTLQAIADGVITTNAQGEIEYLNPVAEELTGWRETDAKGLGIVRVVQIVNETSRDAVENPVARCLRQGRVVALSDQTVLVGRRGQEVAIQTSAAPIRDRDGGVVGTVMVLRDVSRERRLRRVLSYQACHDALTGLINRREFESRLRDALATARADPSVRHAVVYVDLDQFKVVNDTCGHPAGDQLLRQVTGILHTSVRPCDVLARLGGDEFGILLENTSVDQALRLADHLRQSIRDFRFQWQDHSLQIGASIGVVEVSQETESVATLLSAADVACYSAKDGGRNRVFVYDDVSATARHKEMRWVSRLTRAADEDKLQLVFQPIVPVQPQAVDRPRYELLLRLSDEQGSIVYPGEFIPAAERYNIMPALDRWVVERALTRWVPSQRHGCRTAPFTVAVNLSGTTLSDQGFLEYLIERLEAHDPAPGALCFEITETAAIANLANVGYFMRELRTRGCLVALDDFGSGLSSFNYLKTLPVDLIKIDGQFVQNIAHDVVDRSMVEAIAQVGRAMGLKTVAERVENQAVLDTLRHLKVDLAQGYHVARPAPYEDFPHREFLQTPPP